MATKQYYRRILLFSATLLLVAISCLGMNNEKSSENDIRYDFDEFRDRCTSIGVGFLASIDGSTMTTHNNDCQDCDFRITHVPAMDWPLGSKRPIHAIRNNYPRYLETPDTPENIHGKDYYVDAIDTSIYEWPIPQAVGFVDQVPHTYAYTLGTYALQNEKQVSIGESTCSSVFVATPVYAGGKALFHMETLTEIALERCDSARCAIQVMGDLASQFGFYGPEFDGPLQNAQDEAGEALTIADASETWMFHIMPDQSGASAIWVAQRVPDDHITVVANQFVIGEINLDNKDYFMASENIFEAAKAANLWSPEDGVPFNFGYVYGTDRHRTAHACTRRVWRVFTLVAPSLDLSPYTDGLQSFGYGANYSQPYPFSVKPDRLLSAEDIMKINRDQYEDTPFDMSNKLTAGAFGDTMRYPPTGKLADPINGVSRDAFAAMVGDPRPISLWRTAYSSITQSRKSLPDEVGAVTWISQYAPHFSTFVPVYASAPATPSSLKAGSLYKMDKKSNWWIHCMVGNYLGRWYVHTIADIRAFQNIQERKIGALKSSSEAKAVQLLQKNSQPSDEGRAVKAVEVLRSFQEQAATSVRDDWFDFFFEMVGKYRDMYKIVDPHAAEFTKAYKYLTVPRWWLELTANWGPPGTHPPDETESIPVHPLNIPSEDSLAAYKAKYPRGPENFIYDWPLNNSTEDDNEQEVRIGLTFLLMSCVLSVFIGGLVSYFGLKHHLNKQNRYIPI